LTPVFILFGPTAVGKTAVLERLFCGGGSAFGAEIVSADSMQVYRGMDVGTAKPDAALRAALPHHLLDIRDPGDQFNVGDFVRLAREAERAIAARGKLPVVTGGTGFYINAFIRGLPEAPPSDPAVRAALKEELRAGGDALWEELRASDAPSAERIHPNDRYRLLRALEVFRLTGKPLSSFKVNADGEDGAARCFIASLERERSDLYARIDRRCARMMRAGLAREVKALFDRRYTPDNPSMKAIGYKEFFYKDSEDRWRMPPELDDSALTQIEERIAQNSRNYAKRQIAYFKNIPHARRFFLEEGDASLQAAAAAIKDELSRFLERAKKD
jgi:tRNA dimethylallyltransferase